jgi:pimeloyl-ACP methyl ester carboxylesterase
MPRPPRVLAPISLRGMTIVLVHGVPETPAIWDRLRAELDGEDVRTLHLPGFGVPVPDGFVATHEGYTAWLVTELEAIGTPVDLVGHDWGGGFVLRLAMTRPDLLRSWASDVCGLLDPAYVWHDNAQVWQTAGEGEAWWDGVLAQPVDVRAELMSAVAGDAAVGRSMAEAMGPLMAASILSLYRSAAQPAMAQWGEDSAAAAARPGLAIVPTEDPYTGGTAMAERAAGRLGAQVGLLDGLHHWWMLQNPAAGAALLRSFWASVS